MNTGLSCVRYAVMHVLLTKSMAIYKHVTVLFGRQSDGQLRTRLGSSM